MRADPLGLTGQVLHGQFRVDDLIEDGPRSALYRGHHLMLDVPVALKCMKPPRDAEAADSMIRRFRHESRLHYKLAQETGGIVRVLASGTAVVPGTGGLCPFMVREWLEGTTLTRYFADRREKGARGHDLLAAVRLLTPAVEAITFAHACGVIHREITPDRLFVAETSEGRRLLVLDFGVAKVTSDHALDIAPASQSVGMSAVESPAYAAPEQVNAGIGAASPATDVYAFALLLLEALRDRPAFEEGGPPIVLRVIDPTRRPTPEALGLFLPARVMTLLADAVRVDPRARPSDLATFWREISEATGEVTRPMSKQSIDMSPPTSSVDAPTRVLDGPSSQAETGRSPLAQSMEMGDGGPMSSNPERTVVMRPGDLLRSLAQEDAEPLGAGAQMFVVATSIPRADAPKKAKDRWTTMVSPGQEEIAEALRAVDTVPNLRAAEPSGPPTQISAPPLAPATHPVPSPPGAVPSSAAPEPPIHRVAPAALRKTTPSAMPAPFVGGTAPIAMPPGPGTSGVPPVAATQPLHPPIAAPYAGVGPSQPPVVGFGPAQVAPAAQPKRGASVGLLIGLVVALFVALVVAVGVLVYMLE